MIKTTAKELRQEAQVHSKDELIKFLKDNDLKVIKSYGGKYPKMEKLTYCVTAYGNGGYLLQYFLNDGSTIKAFTGCSSWMYTCENTNDLPNELYEARS